MKIKEDRISGTLSKWKHHPCKCNWTEGSFPLRTIQTRCGHRENTHESFIRRVEGILSNSSITARSAFSLEEKGSLPGSGSALPQGSGSSLASPAVSGANPASLFPLLGSRCCGEVMSGALTQVSNEEQMVCPKPGASPRAPLLGTRVMIASGQ